MQASATSQNLEYYWASSQDEEECIGYLRERIDEFGKELALNKLDRQILQNWRFYHGMFFGDTSNMVSGGIKYLGEQGEYNGLPINHFRNLLQHLLTLTTQNRPSTEAIAVNADLKSLHQARLGTEILDYYFREKRAELFLKTAVEHALVFNVGYVKCCWDPSAGRAYAGNVETGKIYNEGDIHLSNPTAWDVVYDLTNQSWEKNKWVQIRSYENRWDLAARYPDKREEILEIDTNEENVKVFWNIGRKLNNFDPSDNIPVWEFYHEKTDALPEGRYVKFVGKTILVDTPLPYRSIPLHRVTAGELLLTCFGYSPANDLQGLQEAFNNEVSTILTNHKSFGIQAVWCKDHIEPSLLKEGLILLESNEEPKGINLTATPPEISRFVDTLLQNMEYVSGINSVARGQPEASLKSGSALALIDSKAVQFASSLIHSYYMLIEDVGGAMLRILRDYADQERVISILGKHNRVFQKFFAGDDLELVDRVKVMSANIMARTLPGRMEMAKDLLQNGLIKLPEEYLNVVQTGQIESMLEADNAQLSLVREENEILMEGGNVMADLMDNHVLHLREHGALLNSTEARMNQILVANVRGHCATHLQMAVDPEGQAYAQMLGHPILLPPMGGMDPGAQNVPPGGTGTAPGGSKPGDTNIPNEAPSQAGVGATTPPTMNEPEGSARMPRMPRPPEIAANNAP